MKRKNLMLTALLSFSSVAGFAQFAGMTTGTVYQTTPSDKIGIGFGSTGTSGISHPLTVNGDIKLFEAGGDLRNIFGTGSTGGINIVGNSTFMNGSVMRLFGSSGSFMPGGIQFMTNIGNATGVAMEWANYDGANWTSMLNLLGNGNFGVGTFPVDKLSVKGNISLYYPADDKDRFLYARSDNQSLILAANTTTDNGSLIRLWGNNSVGHGAITFYTNGAASADGAFMFTRDGGAGNYTDLMRISKEGKVFIGDAPLPTGAGAYNYKLYVQNGILTERVKVALTTSSQWSDFVFDDDYKLMPLSEVESYIEENNHLPEIPSTKEVLKDGLDLAAMDAKLLQKVEELTLYVIQQQKEIEKLKGQVKRK